MAIRLIAWGRQGLSLVWFQRPSSPAADPSRTPVGELWVSYG